MGRTSFHGVHFMLLFEFRGRVQPGVGEDHPEGTVNRSRRIGSILARSITIELIEKLPVQ